MFHLADLTLVAALLFVSQTPRPDPPSGSPSEQTASQQPAQREPGPGLVVLAAQPRATASDSAAQSRIVLVTTTDDVRIDSDRVAARARESDSADRELAAALDGVDIIELRGGTWIAWYQAANEQRHEREWTRALRRAHRAGAEVHASGGAAAWVARWSPVARAALDKPAQDPHDISLDVPVEGLGLFDEALVGVPYAGAATVDRVLERAVQYGYRSVLLLEGTAEFRWDPRARTALVATTDSATGSSIVWVDFGAGRRSRDSVYAAQVGWLGNGDVLDARMRAPVGGIRREATAAEGQRIDDWIRRLSDQDLTDPERPRESAIRVARRSSDERMLRASQNGVFDVDVDLEFQRR